MSPVLDTMPPGTKAEVLRRVLGMAHKYEKGAVAAAFDLTIGELQAIIDHHGGTNRGAMYRHMTELARAAEAQEEESDGAETVDSIEDVPAIADELARVASETHPESDQDDDDGPEPGLDSTLGKLTRVPVARLSADPQNLRYDLTDIEELADTIKEVGLLQPILVRTEGQRLIVVDGHRRLAAVRRLRWAVVPTIVRPSMKTSDVIAAMLITSGQRADLDPIEEARGLMQLKVARGNITDAEVGAVVGRTQVFVSGRLALLNLTSEEQEEVRAGNMKLVEATHRGRSNAGKVNKGGQDKNWHLGPQHTLSNRVKARCVQAGHKRGRTIGGMGCGECWESVIRADERVHLVQESARKGQCDTCGGVVAPHVREGANQ